MKIKSILIVSFLLISNFVFAEDNSVIYNTWILEKVDNEGTMVDYVGFDKTYTLVITSESISYAGSCTPCIVTDFTIEHSTITYAEGAACVPGCCFFKTPQETLMHQPNFEGSFILKDNTLSITSGSTIYFFVVQVKQ